MQITEKTFEAFLKCKTKAYLYFRGAVGVQSQFSDWHLRLRERFEQTGWKQLSSNAKGDRSYVETAPRQVVEEHRNRSILDYRAVLPEIHSSLHTLELIRSASNTLCPYLPIRFVPSEKLKTSDRLLLAFDALALSQIVGKTPQRGRIIQGSHYATATIRLAGLLDKVRAVLGSIAAQESKATPPPLVLNKHCAECEFQSRCRQKAIEKDDLSLLSNITEKEIKRQHEKGIFTVTQLSYAFRPSRRPPTRLPQHKHALKALAIRKNQIHILGAPDLSVPGTPVYFDVEGDPDRDFYYLVGLRIKSGGSSVYHSFWADDPSHERQMWANCLRALSGLNNPRLIHYGAYESQFLQRMRTRYPNLESSVNLGQLISSALNLLSLVYAHVYFPTYSNGLKDVARYLGFSWSEPAASGLAALAWRSQWESSHEPSLKQKLLTYNAEDCEAAEKVTEALHAVCRTESSPQTSRTDVVNVGSLKREYPQRFGEVEFVLPEFQRINEAAYWDYQRTRVYVRSNRRLRRLSREALKEHSLTKITVNKIIRVEEHRPAACPGCNSSLIYKWGRESQVVYDLRFSPAGGIKKWVARYSFHRYICWHCKATIQQYLHKYKYGMGLCAYLLYQIIEMRIPQNAVAHSIKQLFALPLSRGSINRLKATVAGRYRATYRAILDRIVAGKLVHVDETKAKIDRKDGYVWVFTNLEEVAFVYSNTRECVTPREVLRNFGGVLVSDFYAGYDSIDCAQQKCLIHLIRDLNDDLCKQPFNEEMKELAQEFGSLIRPMIESVDRFGLKAHHLRKHKSSVNRFYDALSRRDYHTEVATGYKKRFEKNRDKLFTFLDHDGLPWNNNNAEHAIKAFVRLRRAVGGMKSSTAGIQDYLLLLSISETCKYKGVSFLDFLRSGEVDINSFAGGSRAVTKTP